MDYRTTKQLKRLMIKLIPSTAIGLLLFLSSCYYDNEEALYPKWPGSEVCDTASAPTYNLNISKIIDKNCIGCHYTNSPDARVPLDSYSNLVSAVHDGSLHLVDRINYVAGYTGMPQAGKLSDCNIAIIQRWIDQSMPE